MGAVPKPRKPTKGKISKPKKAKGIKKVKVRTTVIGS
jgi:hypothetical protein